MAEKKGKQKTEVKEAVKAHLRDRTMEGVPERGLPQEAAKASPAAKPAPVGKPTKKTSAGKQTSRT